MIQPMQHIEKHHQIKEAGKSPAEHLMEITGLSKQKLKQAMQKGAVWVGEGNAVQRIRRASKQLKPGEMLHLYYDENVLSEIPATPELISDEDVYSIWNKPYGMRSQGSKWGDHCTINRWVEQHLLPQRPAFIVHRLDRAATGLIIIAHTRKMAAAFSQLFRERKIMKYYQVSVHGNFPNNVQGVTLNSSIDDKPAVSHVHLISYDEITDVSILNVNIETGRKHQIRRHLAEAGFPVVGDRLYGLKEDASDLALMSCKLEFECPAGGGIKQYALTSAIKKGDGCKTPSGTSKTNPDQNQTCEENSSTDGI